MYQSLLHISWVDRLLDNIRIIFVDLYQDQLKKPNTSLVECHFDEYFDQQIRELESSPGGVSTRQQLEALPDQNTPPSSSGTGSDDPPPIPGLLKGAFIQSLVLRLGADFGFRLQLNHRYHTATPPLQTQRRYLHRTPLDQLHQWSTISFPQRRPQADVVLVELERRLRRRMHLRVTRHRAGGRKP